MYVENNEYLGDNVVAVGNLLFSEQVAVAIGQGFEGGTPDLHIAERLVRGLGGGQGGGRGR